MTQWQKQDRPFCIGLIDIDHFKQINDTYGHPAGDEVLKQVARLVQSELPDAICVARFGGEEFSLLTLASPRRLPPSWIHFAAGWPRRGSSMKGNTSRLRSARSEPDHLGRAGGYADAAG